MRQRNPTGASELDRDSLSELPAKLLLLRRGDILAGQNKPAERLAMRRRGYRLRTRQPKWIVAQDQLANSRQPRRRGQRLRTGLADLVVIEVKHLQLQVRQPVGERGYRLVAELVRLQEKFADRALRECIREVSCWGIRTLPVCRTASGSACDRGATDSCRGESVVRSGQCEARRAALPARRYRSRCWRDRALSPRPA